MASPIQGWRPDFFCRPFKVILRLFQDPVNMNYCLSSRLWPCAWIPPSRIVYRGAVKLLDWSNLVIFIVCVPCVRALLALAVSHLTPLPRSSLEQVTAPWVHNLVTFPWEPNSMVSQALLLGVSPSKTSNSWVLVRCFISLVNFWNSQTFLIKYYKVWFQMVKTVVKK